MVVLIICHIIEFRLGSIFVLLFSEIIKRSIIVSVSVRFLILIIVSLDFIYISFFRNRYGEINTIDLESIYCRLILLSKHDTRTNFNY